MPDCILFCRTVRAEISRRAEGQLGVHIVTLECGDQAGVTAGISVVPLGEWRAGGGAVVGVCEEVKEVFEATRLDHADKLDEGIEKLEGVRCVVWDGAIVAWSKDATRGDVVFASPERIAALQAVEVLVVSRVSLARVSATNNTTPDLGVEHTCGSTPNAVLAGAAVLMRVKA